MATTARIPMTNVFMDGDYTGQFLIGPHQQPMNLILDTGSSALAVDGLKYKPDLKNGDVSTKLAQTDSYGDGSTWTGAVLKSKITAGAGAAAVSIPDGNVAVAYSRSANMFNDADGILGLAYAPLDDAFAMPKDTWANKYTAAQVRAGKGLSLMPYMTQLTKAGVVSDKMAFVTHRSFVHAGGGGASDPLNQGLLLLGGGEEATDLYTGAFQTVKVLSDAWYCTNLKSLRVGDGAPIAARIQGPSGMPSNSIIDSGTNSLNLGPQMLDALLTTFSASQRALLNKSIQDQQLISVEELDIASWPTIEIVMQGDSGDVTLAIPPTNYWQVNTEQVGAATAAITPGQAGLAILGLPLMNGYFTIFDGEADNGRGVVKFAPLKAGPRVAASKRRK